MIKRGDTGFTRWGLLALAGGLGISLMVTSLVGYSNREYTRQAITASVGQAADAIVNRLRLYQYGLLGARGAVLTAGEQHVTREIFRRYSQSRNFETEFPGARGFGFVRRVPEDQLADYVRRVRASGESGFELKQITPHSGDRFVVEFLEPGLPNQNAIGYDMASE